MKSKDILFKWFGEMITKYHNIKFFYKYNTNHKSHYIAVFPKDIVDSDDYCEKENSIYESLSMNFENESFLFATEDKRFKITDEFFLYSIDNIPLYNVTSDTLKQNPDGIYKTNTIVIKIDQDKVIESKKDTFTKIYSQKGSFQLN